MFVQKKMLTRDAAAGCINIPCENCLLQQRDVDMYITYPNQRTRCATSDCIVFLEKFHFCN